MKTYLLSNFKKWNTIFDYESDENSVILINKLGKKVAEYQYPKFTYSDFIKFKQEAINN